MRVRAFFHTAYLPAPQTDKSHLWLTGVVLADHSYQMILGGRSKTHLLGV
jgi:hypothetical protein